MPTLNRPPKQSESYSQGSQNSPNKNTHKYKPKKHDFYSKLPLLSASHNTASNPVSELVFLKAVKSCNGGETWGFDSSFTHTWTRDTTGSRSYSSEHCKRLKNVLSGSTWGIWERFNFMQMFSETQVWQPITFILTPCWNQSTSLCSTSLCSLLWAETNGRKADRPHQQRHSPLQWNFNELARLEGEKNRHGKSLRIWTTFLFTSVVETWGDNCFIWAKYVCMYVCMFRLRRDCICM